MLFVNKIIQVFMSNKLFIEYFKIEMLLLIIVK